MMPRDESNRARLTGKDGEAGRLLSQLGGRKQQMEDRMTELQVTKEREVSFWLKGTKAKRNLLIETEPLSTPHWRVSVADDPRASE